MVRPTQLLHPPREPAPPRAAATVLLMRDTSAGPELLMTRRSATASFAPGAYVFPGGAIDTADAAAHALATHRDGQQGVALTQAIAAIRECFEELGVLLARTGDGRPVGGADLTGLDRHASLLEQCRTRGWRLAADEVFVLAHWTTDRDMAKRFEVPFLVARMPEGQEPVADEAEQFEPLWVRPAEALARHQAGQFSMIFPTIRTLERLAAFDRVDSLLQACASGQPLWTSCPRAGWLGGREARFMEHEAAYGELALVCPDGQILHALDWQHDKPVPLLRHLLRLTAGNRGMMTGPGTNTYLVGDADCGWGVIDPGPSDAAHIERILAATQGDIRWIACTHSHPDHSPAARPLQARCPGPAPIWGLPSAPTAEPHSAFEPDRILGDGERLCLEGNGRTHTLQAIHTPGHAANHLCLLLEEDALLFSGDHILNGSTTVVNPPDGHMGAYLDSLDRLSALCERQGVEFILPAHGHVLGFAQQAIATLKRHRLQREAKVAAAMRALPEGTLDDWLPLVYDDTPERLWPVARRSLQAHVQRLQGLAAGE
ncbi:MBL fold metallo-hydrolase [Ramlibacter sp. AW1]|uniref:MBL fold metallo-hydrolase n=1 Tax=Ramlibacter aurantiacus TaxID=2801330 RepID=A0A936ZTF0_9BURK|nr:MBL fold metallo-hydrolase [Ramlibacter aurantiacus]MBL0422231.1 MBL fold metallo-hydrolase [Ramlibacter aurantiacus]